MADNKEPVLQAGDLATIVSVPLGGTSKYKNMKLGDVVEVEGVYVNKSGNTVVTLPGTDTPGMRSWRQSCFKLHTRPQAAPEYDWVKPSPDDDADGLVDMYVRVDLGAEIYVEGYAAPAPAYGRRYLKLRGRRELCDASSKVFSLDHTEVRVKRVHLPTLPGHYLSPTGESFRLDVNGVWWTTGAPRPVVESWLKEPQHQPLRRFTLDA